MIDASAAWKELHARNLLPETNVEIMFRIATDVSEIGGQYGKNEDEFSMTRYLMDYYGGEASAYHLGTLEHNAWALDGTAMFPDAGMCYLGDEETDGTGVTVYMVAPTKTRIPGITIRWSASEQEGYASQFSVNAKLGGATVASTFVGKNTSYVSVVNMELESYDEIEILILEWSLPNRRTRIDSILLGHEFTYDKKDIISFEHTQQGHANTGEIPQVSVRFSLDNSHELWNPFNPLGNTKYLAERLRIDVRYGLDVKGITEWIDAGSFFLSEWSAPSNGLEASFVAKGAIDLLQNKKFVPNFANNSLYDMAFSALDINYSGYSTIALSASDVLKNYPAAFPTEELTSAVVLQMCANAASCVMKHPRSGGVIQITRPEKQNLDYTIPMSLSYSHPEIELSKPMKAVSVSYIYRDGEIEEDEKQTYELDVADFGETQTVDNIFVSSAEQAAEVAEWVKNTLVSRKMVKGEFRADPRLDLYDIVTVESKYGALYPVLITYIKYTYNGSFHGSYEGRVITPTEEE